MSRALEEARVRWCLLRGERRLASPPHDVDILASPDDLDRLADAVGALGFTPVPTWARGTHRFFASYDADTDDWSQLDIVTELAYGPQYELCTRAAEGCLARRVLIGPLAVLAADDAFWTLLLHCMLDRREFPPHQQERLATLAGWARADSELARIVATTSPAGWDSERVLAQARAHDWAAVTRLGPAIMRRWTLRHPLQVTRRVVVGTLQWRLASIHTFLRLRGLRVELVGDPDVVSAVTSTLQSSFYVPARTYRADLRRELNGPRWTKRLKAGLAGIGRLQHSLAIWSHQARGRLVLVERHDTDGRGTAIAGWPRTDLAVVLSPYGRGARNEEVPRARRKRSSRRIVVVDSSQDETSVCRAVTALVWRCFAESRRWL